MNKWKIGYMTRSNDLVWKVIDAETCMEAIQLCMEAEPDYMNCCYSECLTYKKEQP